MDPTLLADLAAAPCGSRALDERIALALGWVRVPGKWRAPLFDAPDGHTKDVPAYTTSMDAALTLVPHGSDAVLHYTAPPAPCLVVIKDQSRLGTCETARTLALATVLAALRAGGAV